MSDVTTTLAHNWAFGIYIFAVLALSALMLLGARVLGGRSKARAKQIPYESGLDAVGQARLRFSFKTYLIAMFFVIFDVQSLYLFSWATAVREAGWFGFFSAAVFIFVILSILYYLVRIGALEWIPARSRRNLQQVKQHKRP